MCGIRGIQIQVADFPFLYCCFYGWGEWGNILTRFETTFEKGARKVGIYVGFPVFKGFSFGGNAFTVKNAFIRILNA